MLSRVAGSERALLVERDHVARRSALDYARIRVAHHVGAADRVSLLRPERCENRKRRIDMPWRGERRTEICQRQPRELGYNACAKRFRENFKGQAVVKAAERLEAGMVTINDAVTPSGLAAAPFGGVKGSGFGRARGVLGLREFANPQVVHDRGPGGLRLHLFPYSDRLGKVFAFYRRLFHPKA